MPDIVEGLRIAAGAVLRAAPAALDGEPRKRAIVSY